MGPTLAIAFGAGLASALLFATMASGSLAAIALFYFAALPVLIAGLGWGHYAAGFAGAVGAFALSVLLRPQLGLFFFLSVGLPSWVLSYLALAVRRHADGGERWTSAGQLLAAIGVGAVALTAIGLAVLFGFDYEAYRASLRTAVDRTLAAMRVAGDTEGLAVFMTAALPVAAAIVWTFVTTLNLYAAGRVVRASGRLARPWPDLPSLRLPRWTAVAVLAGALGTFAGGAPGHLAAIVLAVALAVNVLAGFALAHDLTRGWGARTFALGLVYALTFVIGWPAAFVALAGIADTLFDLRARRRPPSLPDF